MGMETLAKHQCLEKSPCESFPAFLQTLDLQFYSGIEALRNPEISKPLAWISNGVVGIVLLILGLLLIWKSCTHRHFRPRWFRNHFGFLLTAFLFVGLADYLASVLKKYFGRLKPLVDPESEHLRLSFPSNHAFNSAAAGMMLFVLSRQTLEKPGKFLTLSFILSAFIGLSRVYLGEHFASDVLAGILMGSLYGFLAGSLLDAYRSRSRI
jgi:undecaprenyl-diphosphatase